MNSQQLNILVDGTFNLGEDLIRGNFQPQQFKEYVDKVKLIIDSVPTIGMDPIQIRTSELIRSVNIEDFKLSFWQKIFYPYQHTRVVLWPNNSEEQIAKRYMITVNQRLPILIT